jgi:tRNA (cytidine/uridine-2'-O-)-methyltransferase
LEPACNRERAGDVFHCRHIAQHAANDFGAMSDNHAGKKEAQALHKMAVGADSDNNSIQVERHVVLVEPEIHWNTGNIGRTCLAAGASLHLIKPLGFELDSRQVKRAGLDYWPKVDLHVWENFDLFLDALAPRKNEMVLLTKKGRQTFWEMPALPRMILVLGSETRGLPPHILSIFPGQTFRIPTSDDIRSLNLSTAAGIALYESLRAFGGRHRHLE